MTGCVGSESFSVSQAVLPAEPGRLCTSVVRTYNQGYFNGLPTVSPLMSSQLMDAAHQTNMWNGIGFATCLFNNAHNWMELGNTSRDDIISKQTINFVQQDNLLSRNAWQALFLNQSCVLYTQDTRISTPPGSRFRNCQGPSLWMAACSQANTLKDFFCRQKLVLCLFYHWFTLHWSVQQRNWPIHGYTTLVKRSNKSNPSTFSAAQMVLSILLGTSSTSIIGNLSKFIQACLTNWRVSAQSVGHFPLVEHTRIR